MKRDERIAAILAEQARVLSGIAEDEFARLASLLAGAPRIFVYGIGRNGLMLQAFSMRLAHLGLDAHFVGQLAAPPAHPGDVVIAAIALGTLPTADADVVLYLPAQTMADPPASPLPLGGAFELALHLLCEVLISDLMARLDRTEADLHARHANLL